MTTHPEVEVNVPVHVTEDEHYDALAETEDDRSRVEEAHTEREIGIPYVIHPAWAVNSPDVPGVINVRSQG